MNTKIKHYIQIKRDPNLAILRFLESADGMAQNLVKRAISDVTEEARKQFEENIKGLESTIPLIAKEITESIRKEVYARAPIFQGPPGKKGDKGDSVKGEPGDRGEPGYTPVPDLDYPSETSVRKMVEELSPKERDLAPIIAKAMKKLKFETPMVEKLARAFEKLQGEKQLDYYALKNRPVIPREIISKKLGGAGGGGSGAAITFEIPSAGAVNGVNTTFTVANEPKYIVVDGLQKFVTTHYTYSGGTIEITDGAPPVNYIRSAY